MENNLVKSISYDQQEIINWILELHTTEHKIDLDATYSKGVFYADGNVCEPTYKFDINPQYDYVKKCDCRHLPIDDNSIKCCIFDPPFLATTGRSLVEKNDNNVINKRFGVYPSEKELHNFYVDSMKEFYRILKNNGILIFKCQDKVSSGKQYITHNFIINKAQDIGFYTKDLFILLARNRIVANRQLKNQKNARKYHSYFIVFEKTNKKIEYI